LHYISIYYFTEFQDPNVTIIPYIRTVAMSGNLSLGSEVIRGDSLSPNCFATASQSVS